MTRQWLDTGLNGVELEVEYGEWVDAVTGGSIRNSTTAVRLTNAEVWLDNGPTAFSDNTNQLVTSGTAVAAQTVNNLSVSLPANAIARLFYMNPVTRPIFFGAVNTGTIGVTLTGIAHAGTLSGSFSLPTIPERPYAPPNTPILTITSTGVTVSGNRTNPSADQFWEYLDWWTETNDEWTSTYTTTAGTTTSVNRTWYPNNRYRVGARTRNAYGVSSLAYTNYWYTVPAAPTGVTVERGTTDARQITVRWTNNARYRGGVRVYLGVDLVGTAGSSASSFTFSRNLDTSGLITLRAITPQGQNQGVSAASTAVPIPNGYTTPDAPGVSWVRLTSSSARLTITGHVLDVNDPKFWALIHVDLQTGTGGWVEYASALQASDVSQLTITGLVPNQRYRARARVTNYDGSAYAYTGYLYTAPAAPGDLEFSQAQGGDPSISVRAGSTSQYTSSVLVERSTDYGSTWSFAGQTSPGAWLNQTINPEIDNWFRFQARTFAPSVDSSYSTVLVVPSSFSTDTSRIPGVTRIYEGDQRIRQVFSGTNRFWTDGE